MRSFHHDPVLRLFIPDGADLKAVLCLLRSDCAGVDGVHQDLLDNGEIPDVSPILRVFLLPFGADVPVAALPVPPCGAGVLFFLQFAPDVVGAMPVQRIPEDQPDNRGGLPVHQQVVLILRVFPVAERGDTAGELPFLRLQHIKGMDFLGNILAVHLVQDIFEGRCSSQYFSSISR